MQKWEINNINDLSKVAEQIISQARTLSQESNRATVIALHGDLGSGKTTFTKELAKTLGITATVTSPTFVIQKSFDLPKELAEQNEPFQKLIHIDTYRIDLQDELVKLDWNENISQPTNLISLEWPENVSDILPPETIHLHFTFVDETTRLVELK